MTRRVYYVSAKRRKLQEKALQQMRTAREQIDPGLLDTARQAIATAIENHAKRKNKLIQEDTEPVDRKKNLAVIMKFLELNEDNTDIKDEVGQILARENLQ